MSKKLTVENASKYLANLGIDVFIDDGVMEFYINNIKCVFTIDNSSSVANEEPTVVFVDGEKFSYHDFEVKKTIDKEAFENTMAALNK